MIVCTGSKSIKKKLESQMYMFILQQNMFVIPHAFIVPIILWALCGFNSHNPLYQPQVQKLTDEY